MNRLQFSRRAADDLQEICNSAGTVSPRAAALLLKRIESAARLCLQSPQLTQPCDELHLGMRYVDVPGYLIFHRGAFSGVEIVRIVPDPRTVDRDHAPGGSATPNSLLDLAPSLEELGQIDSDLDQWASPKVRVPVPPARVYHVPRRFGIGSLLGVTALFCGLFAAMRLLQVNPMVMAYAGMQIVAAALMQVVDRKRPRLASALAGAVLFPLAVVSYAFMYHDDAWGAVAATPCIAVAGGLFGYLAGGLIAGVFMLTEMADEWIAHRKGDAPAAALTDPLAEENATEHPPPG